jgi:hypothetical protein
LASMHGVRSILPLIADGTVELIPVGVIVEFEPSIRPSIEGHQRNAGFFRTNFVVLQSVHEQHAHLNKDTVTKVKRIIITQ